ncbi:hypothetical protein [Streptomyces spiramyceticus]|uniref:hypothetical protein n=1 Tax=Streptomyces spiramyceticus TaxID=299717 RepID=UPI00237B5553|nr:hypothetical protein [Streptomyces spiramyceticus]
MPTNATDIAAYQYLDQTVCPQCTKDVLTPFELVGDPDRSTEDVLNDMAQRWRIDRHADDFSSEDFPKPIYAPDLIPGESCFVCGTKL